MGYAAVIKTIFLSSPNDVVADIDKIVRAIGSWNQRNGRSRGVHFQALTWKQTVAPDIGSSGQEVINQQVGAEYDIYLGVMWSKFGSPTENASSGTEDEFNQAVDRHRNGEPLSICFLFNNSPIPQNILVGTEYVKVQDFKTKVGDCGCLYREYVDEASLIDVVNLILDRAANSTDTSMENPVAASHQGKGIIGDRQVSVSYADDAQELGLFDYNEKIDSNVMKFTRLMAEWTERMERSGVISEESTEELNSLSRFGAIEPKAAKRIINKVSSYINAMVDWGEENQSQIDDCLEGISEGFSGIVTVSGDFDQSEEDTANAIHSGEQFIETISNTNDSLTDLASTVLSLPRISKEMIRSGKRLSAYLENMVLKNNTFAKNIAIAVEELKTRR